MGTLRCVLKYELALFQRSFPALSRRPLRVFVLLRRPIISTVIIFVVTGISWVHSFGHVAPSCVNIHTHWDHGCGCYAVRKFSRYILLASIRIPWIVSSMISSVKFFALFVAALFYFSQTFSPVWLCAYILWPFVLNYSLVVPVSASFRLCTFPVLSNSDLQKGFVSIPTSFLFHLSFRSGVIKRTFRVRSFSFINLTLPCKNYDNSFQCIYYMVRRLLFLFGLQFQPHPSLLLH